MHLARHPVIPGRGGPGAGSRAGGGSGPVGGSAQSTNWSGYAGTSGTFSTVSASWTQPASSCGSGNQYAAFWVGLDGLASSTVEQIGTEADCRGPDASYYAWYELYPGASQNYPDPVQPGDQITASVTYRGDGEFSLSITDATQGWRHTTQAATGQTPGLSSAEAIAEAPCCTAGGAPLPLTDFGAVNYADVTANGSPIGEAAGPTQVAMVNDASADKDAVSELTDGQDFSATWLSSS